MTSHRTRGDVIIDGGFWVLTAACVAATSGSASWQPPPGASLFTGADKVGHAVAFFTTTLSFLLAAVWRPGRGKGRFPEGWRWFLPAAAAGSVMIEIIQGMIPTRTAETYDLLAGAIGIATAVVIHALIRWRMAPRVAQLDPRV